MADAPSKLESQALELKPDLEDEFEEEEEEVVQTCEFTRPERKKADECAVCGPDPEGADPKEKLLQIEFTEFLIVLCPEHEGMLLQKLLNNYVKRVTKQSKVGFLGQLIKEKEKEEPASCSSIAPSL